MMGGRLACAAALALVTACGGGGAPDADLGGYTPPDVEAPVPVGPETPIQYPAALYERQVEGDVVLRMFVDSTGRVVPESTTVAEASGHPALDTAALVGSARLRFAPARRRGVPVATSFLQPVEFRHPKGPE